MERKTLILALLIAASMVCMSYADIPQVINFQGKATDKKDGAPLNSDTTHKYDLTFRIYTKDEGGTAEWEETHKDVTITNGIFQVLLGSITPFADANLEFKEDYWISVEVNTDGEMDPRTRLASVGYAYTAEKLAEEPVIPFYKKGFDIEYVDFNSVKIAPGVMDMAGTMFTTTTYSDPIQLEYIDDPKYRNWVSGQKTNNSYAYVYVCNKGGELDFKFSDEAPDLSDHLGNADRKPLLYQEYDNLYYRYIGAVKIDSLGHVEKAENIKDADPFSMFPVFGGRGMAGDITVSSNQNFSELTGTPDDYYLESDNFTVEKDKTLTIDTGWAYIAVKGTCTIHGTISADGQGEGTDQSNGQGKDALGSVSRGKVANCTTGAGGAGATYSRPGGDGGGASGNGGRGGSDNKDGEAASIKQIYDGFWPLYLHARGAGGGTIDSGANRNTDCQGGGVVYIECDKLIFDGEIRSDGDDGEQACGGAGGGLAIVRARNIARQTGSISARGGKAGLPAANVQGGNGADGFADMVLVQ